MPTCPISDGGVTNPPIPIPVSPGVTVPVLGVGVVPNPYASGATVIATVGGSAQFFNLSGISDVRGRNFTVTVVQAGTVNLIYSSGTLSITLAGGGTVTQPTGTTVHGPGAVVVLVPGTTRVALPAGGALALSGPADVRLSVLPPIVGLTLIGSSSTTAQVSAGGGATVISGLFNIRRPGLPVGSFELWSTLLNPRFFVLFRRFLAVTASTYFTEDPADLLSDTDNAWMRAMVDLIFLSDAEVSLLDWLLEELQRREMILDNDEPGTADVLTDIPAVTSELLHSNDEPGDVDELRDEVPPDLLASSDLDTASFELTSSTSSVVDSEIVPPDEFEADDFYSLLLSETPDLPDEFLISDPLSAEDVPISDWALDSELAAPYLGGTGAPYYISDSDVSISDWTLWTMVMISDSVPDWTSWTLTSLGVIESVLSSHETGLPDEFAAGDSISETAVVDATGFTLASSTSAIITDSDVPGGDAEFSPPYTTLAGDEELSAETSGWDLAAAFVEIISTTEEDFTDWELSHSEPYYIGATTPTLPVEPGAELLDARVIPFDSAFQLKSL